jgi:hypothetical protein
MTGELRALAAVVPENKSWLDRGAGFDFPEFESQFPSHKYV